MAVPSNVVRRQTAPNHDWKIPEFRLGVHGLAHFETIKFWHEQVLNDGIRLLVDDPEDDLKTIAGDDQHGLEQRQTAVDLIKIKLIITAISVTWGML